MVRALFIMEQHIGHRSFYQNLRQFVEAEKSLAPEWVEVTYEETPPTLIERIPFLPKNISGSLVGRRQIQRGLRRPHDVVVFNTQVPAVLAGRAVHRKPYVICTDITPGQFDEMAEHYGHRPDREGIVSQLKRNANLAIFAGAARLLPWSTWTRDSLVADYGVDPARIEVIPPGVDTEIWQPREPKQNGPFRILFIGGDFYRKGGEVLLKAFRSLPPGTAELVLVTHTPLPPEPNIQIYNDMTPNSPELIALCQSCDAFAFPTLAEAFGIAAVEACALGLPIIATNVGGLRDIVIDRQTGFLIPPGDLQAFIHGLRELCDNPQLRHQMGQAARELAVGKFDAKKNAGRVVEILYEIINGGRGYV